MKQLLIALALVGTLVSLPASAISFSDENFDFAVPSDCVLHPNPQPDCIAVDAFGTANDIADAIPGSWIFGAHLEVLFGIERGPFYSTILRPPTTTFSAPSRTRYSRPMPRAFRT